MIFRSGYEEFKTWVVVGVVALVGYLVTGREAFLDVFAGAAVVRVVLLFLLD